MKFDHFKTQTEQMTAIPSAICKKNYCKVYLQINYN